MVPSKKHHIAASEAGVLVADLLKHQGQTSILGDDEEDGHISLYWTNLSF